MSLVRVTSYKPTSWELEGFAINFYDVRPSGNPGIFRFNGLPFAIDFSHKYIIAMTG
jgi:hypothetical protein